MIRPWRTFLLLLSTLWLGGALASPAAAQADRPLPGGNEAYSLSFQPAKRVRAELTYEIKAPKLNAQEWIIYAPQLPVTQGQTEVSSTFEPSGVPAHEASPEKRPILRARVMADESERHGVKIRAEYETTLWSRRLVPRGKDHREPPPLKAEERRNALASGNVFDLESEGFQRWLSDHELRRAPKEGEIDFARRVFLAIKKDFQYEWLSVMDRHASKICDAKKSDCGGMSVVFASALRANKIPARVLVGRWALSTETQPGKEPDQRSHVKAEFYAQGVGWVPADLSVAVVHDRSPEGLRYFGNDPGDHVTMHLDTDLLIDTIHFGRKPIEWLQGPTFWATGSGSFEGMSTQENWTVTTLPPRELREASLKKSTTSAKPKKTEK